MFSHKKLPHSALYSIYNNIQPSLQFSTHVPVVCNELQDYSPVAGNYAPLGLGGKSEGNMKYINYSTIEYSTITERRLEYYYI